MAVYSPGNPLGAKADFDIMADRAVGSINSLPLVMNANNTASPSVLSGLLGASHTTVSGGRRRRRASRGRKVGGNVKEFHGTHSTAHVTTGSIKSHYRGGRRSIKKGKGSAGSWAAAVTKYYKDARKTRKNMKFTDALREASKLKKAGKFNY